MPPSLSYLLLGCATVLLWVYPKHPVRGLGVFGVSVIVALITERLNFIGLTAVFALGLALRAGYHSRPQPRLLSILAHASIVILGTALISHWMPGFQNLKVIDAIKFSYDSRPYSMYLNFDKGAVGFLIAYFVGYKAQSMRDWKNTTKTALLCIAPCAALLMSVALLIRFVRFDPKLPSQTGIWMFSNILFTAVPEEMFFRYYIQKNIFKIVAPKRSWIAIVIASIIFGIFPSHLKAGVAFVALATIAGIFYGYAYLKSNRIEAAIITHSAVNATHFLLFSYLGLMG